MAASYLIPSFLPPLLFFAHILLPSYSFKSLHKIIDRSCHRTVGQVTICEGETHLLFDYGLCSFSFLYKFVGAFKIQTLPKLFGRERKNMRSSKEQYIYIGHGLRPLPTQQNQEVVKEVIFPSFQMNQTVGKVMGEKRLEKVLGGLRIRGTNDKLRIILIFFFML
eukprot:TRINITY_DN416_c0_g2_i4.p2 TRINITY_DN416_c0_g2~~TRINITY_DN416_c0_g2_i4.p2  ORF type:complete len:165 (+),score=18.93 TRINITY_DN416_c0_g2_i4:570-1064(+)